MNVGFSSKSVCSEELPESIVGERDMEHAAAASIVRVWRLNGVHIDGCHYCDSMVLVVVRDEAGLIVLPNNMSAQEFQPPVHHWPVILWLSFENDVTQSDGADHGTSSVFDGHDNYW